jgi:hypothetical protein
VKKKRSELESEGEGDRLSVRAAQANERTKDAKERAARLEVEALSLRAELLRQGARENLLSGKNRTRLVDALKPFAGQAVHQRMKR